MDFNRKRISAIILMLYLAIMVYVANEGLTGDIFTGYYWRSGGWSLFPIPLNPSWFGWGTTLAFVSLTIPELIVYLIFVGHGIWVFWEILGGLYIIYPWTPFLQSIVSKGKPIIVDRVRRGN